MKKGDKVPVTIAGDVAAQAVVESVDMDTRQATLVIPATRVIMALRVEIDSAPQVAETEPAKQTIITGVDRVDSEGNIIEGASTGEPVASESAPVGGNGENAESANAANASTSSATETPVGTETQTEVVAPTPPVETVQIVEKPVGSED